MSSGHAMQSKVGNPQVYSDGDQRPTIADERAEVERMKSEMAAGQKNAHDIHDPKDSRNLHQRAQQEEILERQQEREERARTVTDPLEPATSHGNKPSRGAEIDAELQREDEEMLAKKGR
ncbi:uncharacterized protein BXZ73DRAFT_81618 [Epithele typhae]|uniref:uncharacterized protein n=1 Tax=Epithele typhae TaxID=378194 RepID=UPI0020079B94|nr:uncharacterized protein BXZ73DRAFT_81618 [Epithele typhae]KAH9914652.1 hypothetical protein BXZ73DRAFT_81618 [Epithele typhae]